MRSINDLNCRFNRPLRLSIYGAEGTGISSARPTSNRPHCTLTKVRCPQLRGTPIRYRGRNKIIFLPSLGLFDEVGQYFGWSLNWQSTTRGRAELMSTPGWQISDALGSVKSTMSTMTRAMPVSGWQRVLWLELSQHGIPSWIRNARHSIRMGQIEVERLSVIVSV